MGMPANERAEIAMAIGNHDEMTGTAVSDISAAIILADKSDAHDGHFDRLAELRRVEDRRSGGEREGGEKEGERRFHVGDRNAG